MSLISFFEVLFSHFQCDIDTVFFPALLDLKIHMLLHKTSLIWLQAMSHSLSGLLMCYCGKCHICEHLMSSVKIGLLSSRSRHNEGQYNQNVTVSASLLNSWSYATKLSLMMYHHKSECLVKILDCSRSKSQGRFKIPITVCLDTKLLQNRWAFCNQTWSQGRFKIPTRVCPDNKLLNRQNCLTFCNQT